MSEGTPSLVANAGRWRRPLWALAENDRIMRRFEWLFFAILIALATASYLYLRGSSEESRLVAAPIAAAMLVANLIPAIVLLVLLGRRIAKGRAAKSAVGGSGRLHVRLVALFSLVASVPMLLVVIFASLLFQYGVEFWFSDRARGMLENANDLARGYYDQNRKEVGQETLTMATDLRNYLQQARLESPEFAEGYVFQVLSRKLNESAIIEIGNDGVARTAALVDPENREPRNKVTPDVVKKLQTGAEYVVTAKSNKIEAVTPLDLESQIYLYAARDSDMLALSQWERAQAVLSDYDALLQRSRNLQLRFNIALFVVSLMIVGLALFIALVIADRMVRPVGDLVDAAKRVTEGDLATRVPVTAQRDELGVLGRSFNRMTERLETQTTALITANEQLGNRRAFIEAVLESVTSGIISLNETGEIQLMNNRAQALLSKLDENIIDRKLSDVAPELAELIDQNVSQQLVQIAAGTEIRSLEVKIVAGNNGHVITFEDMTQQLLDQRRAAWSDVARRIAHEIKNPLTPIQLAAERLQRRFGAKQADDSAIFTGLTETIVRQVGDLRKIVDEFSSFARMPKPIFRQENLNDIIKQALFLQGVAHPAMSLNFTTNSDNVSLVCDRRQIGQVLTNILKNAIEAIEQRAELDAAFGQSDGAISITVAADDCELVINIDDNGVGLPHERERIVEPYMTTREKGTGLGLAIVSKIVEEHFGEISFSDAAGQGTRVTLKFPIATLARLNEADHARPLAASIDI